ncbi:MULTISPECIES: hypothetical protein [Colwellia]|uniref:Prevent-host-death protein n=1 Tax=Colwellia marinimaniae TaxID=1513592 RepID=A0ABQ0MU45_9GAMM|nr:MULTISPECIES: hypothetical protein [Colwellia]GAW95737.1 hypothetical protein MTCD1_01340 [Colwellia marinimaniae]
MNSITANELKRNGVAGIERVMLASHDSSVMVDVRGKTKYVILSADEFNQYREYQLDQAIKEAEQSLANNEFEIIKNFDGYAQVLEKEIKDGI